MHTLHNKAERSPSTFCLLISAWSVFVIMSLTNNSAAQEAQNAQGGSQDMPVSTAKPKSLLDAPPNLPQVSCTGNQLTIKADNATLGSVLNAVEGCIGKKIELPDGGAGERLYTQFGPGPIKEVLTSLLSSMDYDFVIGTSAGNPQKIETVLLMRRTEDNPAPAAADVGGGRARRAWAETRRNTETATRAAREESGQAEPEPVASTTPATTPTAAAENASVEQPQAPASPADAPAVETASASNSAVPVAAAAASPASSGKNTQDLISDMRQLFEQRRQMTQGQKATPQ